MNTTTKKFRTNVAAFCILWGIVVGTLDAIDIVQVNDAVFTTVFGFGAGMMSVGRFGKGGNEDAVVETK